MIMIKDIAKLTREERYESASWWLAQGFDLVPMKPYTKHLYYGYGYSKKHISQPDEAEKWFAEMDTNLGVVLGGEKGLVVADWDDFTAYKTWAISEGCNVQTRTERTARGVHLFFTGKGFRSASGGGCDLLASGICMVTPSVHPSGTVYKVTNDAPIAELDMESAQSLFPFLSDKRKPLIPKLVENRYKSEPNGNGVIDRIKFSRSTVDEMQDAGVDLKPSGPDFYVGLCPFHDDHHPSLWVSKHTGTWGCNKPSCPAAGYHDVINFRSMFRKISNADAIREMAKKYLSD